ncbi:MAG: SMC-Scp complex subunit ScpB [Saccharofermentanales bacterium]|jgi:segregation and condensation protein B
MSEPNNVVPNQPITEEFGGLVQESKAELIAAAERAAMEKAENEQLEPLDPAAAPAAIEALLFAAGDPLTLEQISRILVMDKPALRRVLDELILRYERDTQRGLQIRETNGSFTIGTKPELKYLLARLFSPRHRPPLSAAAYETLAVIAYNQPVTRAQIEAVRGVNSDNVLQRLIERALVHEVGTLDTPGRPTLFATTDQFLLDFGLRSVKELPPMEMLMYSTLQDIEHALEDAANINPDKQVTIDQIVNAFVPGVAQAGNETEAAVDSKESESNLTE